jgi:hypothetical protein
MSGEIEKLIERVEAATEGHPMLNLDVYLAVEGLTLCGGFMAERADGTRVKLPMSNPHYTSSVDDAIALANRLGDGSAEHPVEMTLSSAGKPVWRCAIWLGNEETDGVYRTAATPALAIILATLRALSSKEGM